MPRNYVKLWVSSYHHPSGYDGWVIGGSAREYQSELNWPGKPPEIVDTPLFGSTPICYLPISKGCLLALVRNFGNLDPPTNPYHLFRYLLMQQPMRKLDAEDFPYSSYYVP